MEHPFIVSASMSKTGASRPTDADAPVFTAKTENATTPVSDVSVSQNSQEINPANSGQMGEPVAVEQGQSINFPQEETITTKKVEINPPTVGRHATNISSEGVSTFGASIPQTASESNPFPLDTKKEEPANNP